MRFGRFTFLALALCVLCDVKAASRTPEELERLVFQSMMMSPDLERSRLGLRMLFQQSPNDQAECDYVAERLLKMQPPKNAVETDSISWFVRTLNESCPPRYHDALTLARTRITHRKIVEHFDLALARTPDSSIPQYAEGGVDLLARQLEIEQQLNEIQRATAKGVPHISQGITLGEMVETAGLPQDFSSLTLRVARWGRQTVLVAHYGGTGMLIFRRDISRNRWTLADSYPELFPVSSGYQGSQFAIAQSVACLRGLAFFDYVKIHNIVLRQDHALTWVLAHRLSANPFPLDDYEEAGLRVSLDWIYNSPHADKLDMTRQVAAAPGDKLPKVAREYVLALEKRAAKQAAASR